MSSELAPIRQDPRSSDLAPHLEISVDEQVERLSAMSKAVELAGDQARAYFTLSDTEVVGCVGIISSERSIKDYGDWVGFNRNTRNRRIALLEEVVRPNDRVLFTLAPSEMMKQLLERGGRMFGTYQMIIPDLENPGRHSEAAFKPGERLMLSIPIAIPRAQYLFAADRTGDVIQVTEHIEFSAKCVAR